MAVPRCIGCGAFHSPDTPCPDGTVWWRGLVECRICTHRQVSVVPIRPGDSHEPDNLQCANCDNYSCDPVEED
jgi:hypothetical protein